MKTTTLWAMALATTCLWPLAGRADDDFGLDDAPATPLPVSKPVLVNEAGIEAGAVSGARGRFNRYRGGATDGAAGTAWFHTEGRATGKDDGTFYFMAEGEDLDLAGGRITPDGSLRLRFGEQGTWAAGLSYEGIALRQSDSLRTLFGSSGELLNGLAARSLNTTATNAAGAARLNNYLSTVDVGTRRDKITGDARYSAIPDWTVSTRLEHEHKQGTKINSLLFFNSSVFATIPEPVDYDTDRFTASAAYTTRPVQATLAYVFSSFTNNQQSFQTVTPFNVTTIGGYRYSELSLPPSNQEHRLKAQFGINPTDTTHVAINLASALQLQNDSYGARLYERSPRVADSSFDGLIRTLYGNVALTTRPAPDWNFRAAYTIDDRDNHSSTYRQLAPYRADGTAAFNGSGGVQINPPYSTLNQRADLEVGYRLLKSTKLTVETSVKDTQRDYTVTSRNQEGTIGGHLNTTVAPGLSGGVGYARSDRRATRYDGNAGWAAMGRTLAGGTSEANLKMYSYAARQRDEIKANLNWAAGPDWSLGLGGRYVADQFPDTYFGVTGNHMLSVGPDLTVNPVPAVTTHFYYTYQENHTTLRATPTAATARAEWRLNNRDSVHTAGIRNDWKVNDRLTLSLDDNVSYGNTAFEEASWWLGTGGASAANTATSLPDSHTVINSLKLSAEYRVSDELSFGLSGLWERFISKDYLNWQEASSAANQTATAAVAGEGNPGYSAAVIMVSTRLRW